MRPTASHLPPAMLVTDDLGTQLRLSHSQNQRILASAKLDGVRCLSGLVESAPSSLKLPGVVYGTRSALRWPDFGVFDAALERLAGLLFRQVGRAGFRARKGSRDGAVFGCVFDAELTSRDRRFETVSAIALGGIAERFDELELHIFDVVSPLPFVSRYRALARAFADMPPGPVRLVQQLLLPRSIRTESLQALRDRMAKRPGCEGLVLRLSDGGYVHGASAEAVRLKDEDTEDLRVVEAVPMRDDPTRLSALICDRGGVRVRVGSGFSEAQRVALLASPPSVVEVGHRGATTRGSLRNPNFKRVRTDKAFCDPHAAC